MRTPQRCMSLVDTDRLLWVRERVGKGCVSLSRLEPPTCSPKSSIVLFSPHGVPAWLSDGGASAGAHAALACSDAADSNDAKRAGQSWLALFGGQGAVGGCDFYTSHHLSACPCVRPSVARAHFRPI